MVVAPVKVACCLALGLQLGCRLHREEGAIEDCDFAMHGASQSGAFQGPRVFKSFSVAF